MTDISLNRPDAEAIEREPITDTERFDAAVEHRCEGYIVAPGCRGAQCEHAEGDEDHQCEASFSWSQCDSCGTTLGGDREPASMIPIDDKGAFDYARDIVDIDICTDCVIAWANGDSPETWRASA